MGKTTTNAVKATDAGVNTAGEFRINISECEDFGGIADIKFMTSTDFCKKVAQLFKSVYADVEGCKLETFRDGYGYMQSQIILLFNHTEPDDPNRVNAVTRTPEENDKNSYANQTLRRTRRVDQLYKNGDRYYLTKEGKEGLRQFFFDSVVNRKTGKIDFAKVVAEVSTPSAYYGQPPITCTQISFLDPAKLAAAIYGATDEHGNGFVYEFGTGSSIPNAYGIQGIGFQNRTGCCLMRLYESEVARLSNDLGICFNNGANIVR